MKTLTQLFLLLPLCSLLLGACTTIVKEPLNSTSSHTESSVTRSPTSTTTTVTREQRGSY